MTDRTGNARVAASPREHLHPIQVRLAFEHPEQWRMGTLGETGRDHVAVDFRDGTTTTYRCPHARRIERARQSSPAGLVLVTERWHILALPLRSDGSPLPDQVRFLGNLAELSPEGVVGTFTDDREAVALAWITPRDEVRPAP